MRYKELIIYECGKMGGLSFDAMSGWRKELKNKLLAAASETGYKVLVINPVDMYNYDDPRHQSEEEIEDYDLRLATSSDLIIVNLDGLESSNGSKYELHDCHYHLHIPVIAFGKQEQYKSLHPWTKRDISRVENSIDDVVEYVKDFYFIN